MNRDSHFPKTDFSFSDGIKYSDEYFSPEVVCGFQRKLSGGRNAFPMKKNLIL